MRPIADDRDRAIVARRMEAIDADPLARVGDFIRFADGVERRASYRWEDGVQTSNGGSWYLGDYGGSFSGSLYATVPFETLTPTTERKPGRVWIFHHDYAERDGGVDAWPEFRVYTCTRTSEER